MALIDKNGQVVGGDAHLHAGQVAGALAGGALAASVRRAADDGYLVAFTDNSGGTVQPAGLTLPGAFVGAANDGGSLAPEGDTQTQLEVVRANIAKLIAKYDLIGAAVNSPTPYEWNGVSDLSVDATLASIDSALTGAATGVQVTETNVLRVEINELLSALVARAKSFSVGLNEVYASVPGIVTFTASSDATEWSPSAIPASGTTIDTTATGTAASPGVTVAEINAALSDWADCIASLAFLYNAFVVVYGRPLAGASGGSLTAGGGISVPADVADASISNDGLTQAQAATAIDALRDQYLELFEVSNNLAALRGITTFVYAGGADTAADGTLTSLTAPTGTEVSDSVDAAEVNTEIDKLDTALARLVNQINEITTSLGLAPLEVIDADEVSASVPGSVIETGNISAESGDGVTSAAFTTLIDGYTAINATIMHKLRQCVLSNNSGTGDLTAGA